MICMPAWPNYRPAGHMQPARFFAVDLFSQNLVGNWEFVGFSWSRDLAKGFGRGAEITLQRPTILKLLKNFY